MKNQRNNLVHTVAFDLRNHESKNIDVVRK